MPTLSIRGGPRPSYSGRCDAGSLEDSRLCAGVLPMEEPTAGHAAPGEAVVDPLVGGFIRRIALDRQERHPALSLAGVARTLSDLLRELVLRRQGRGDIRQGPFTPTPDAGIG